MTITPIDIQQHRFKNRPMGYEKAGVDRLLEQVAEELEKYHRQVQELKEELARNRAVLNEMRQREEMLKKTLLMAQKVTEEMKANALKEAEILLAEAGMQAEKIVHEAEGRRIQLLGEIREIKQQKVSFESSLRGMIDGHLRMLELDSFSCEDKTGSGRFLQSSDAGDEGDFRPLSIDGFEQKGPS